MQRGLQNFLVIKVGTGIGCGIVCHGEVYRGANGSAGDVGHICVDPDGPRCHCGNLGCVETMAAGPAIARAAAEAARERPEPAARRSMLGRARRAEAAGRGARPAAPATWRPTRSCSAPGALIGQMLASVVNFYNPSHVFIGGGVAAHRPAVPGRRAAERLPPLAGAVDAPPRDPVHAARRACRADRRRRAGDAGEPASVRGGGAMTLGAVASTTSSSRFGPVRGAARRELRARSPGRISACSARTAPASRR